MSCEFISRVLLIIWGEPHRNIKFKIYKHIGNISEPNNGWTKELNLISWDDREPVYDLRTWNEDHSKMGKGVTVTAGEMKRLQELICDKKVF